MSRKKFRYFMSFFDTQEKWINKMAANGLRLVGTSTFYYEFEPCNPNSYEYRIEFVGAMPYSKTQDYKKFLAELGYKVFTKNLNLNLSFGKIRWRPYGHTGGQIVTSPGGYNNEIFIIEKKRDGKSFELHTNYEDIINYYRSIRNIYSSLLLVVFVFLALKFFTIVSTLSYALIVIVILLLLIPTILYSRQISAYKTLNKTNE